MNSSTSGSRVGEGSGKEGEESRQPMTVKGGREMEEGKGGRNGGRGRGVFVSQERDGGGEREPDAQETEGKQARRERQEKR